MAIMPPSPSTEASSPDAYSDQDLSWLNALPHQSAFASSSSSGPAGHLALRGSDALVALDGQLRIFSLSSLKHANDSLASEYKVLSNPLIAEALAQEHTLALNPLKTLLVIQSETSLVLIILPRTTSLASDSLSIPVKAHKVGAFYHNSRSPREEQIVQVKWHPWSKRGTSLLVLSNNGCLEEYDVARDLHEPQQAIRLLPQASQPSPSRVKSGRSRSTMSPMPGASHHQDLDADPAHQAAAFTLAIGAETSTAWTTLTIYLLTTAGQIFAAAPFLPRHARLPSSFLHSLAAYAQLTSETKSAASRQRDVALRFVSHLLKQARSYQASKAAEESQDGLPGRRSRATTPADVLARGSTPVLSGGMHKSQSLMSIDTPAATTDRDLIGGEDDAQEFVEVQCPDHAVVPGPILPQGPFSLQPAPQPSNEQGDRRGSDLVFRKSNGVELLFISKTDGGVDIAVLNVAGKIAPRWQLSSPPSLLHRGSSTRSGRMPRESGSYSTRSSRDSQVRKSGRFGLDDSSSEEDETDEEDALDGEESFSLGASTSTLTSPTLFIYESLSLALPAMSHLRITLDPVYSDTFYVHHDFGVHMACTSAWDRRLSELLDTEDAQGMQRFLHSNVQSDLRCIVKIQGVTETRAEMRRVSSVEVIDDVYLGYSIIVMMGDGESLGLEMSLRANAQGNSSTEAATPEAVSSPTQRQHYTSLLGGSPFVPPAPFNANDTAATFPTLRLKTSDPQAAKRELTVTPESLRLLGTTVQDLRGQVREVVQGGNAIQRRLELQMKELQRQVGKLNEMRARIERHQGEAGHKDRIERIAANQRKLIERVDRVLQGTMDASDSGVSQYEEAWMKEMEVMERSMGKNESEGLKGKVNKLQGQLEYLKPDLTLLVGSARDKATPTDNGGGKLGMRQLDRILTALGVESDKLVEAKDKVHRLNRSLPKGATEHALR
ncbi:hypothetical protein BDZ90DRAFT_230533 [Jaminaea rosea]|uniref:Uncharacterized protein n=1 Tax=Jaminaea rosea TaxID=1569628 RepID=A0A316UZD6_9BASI|nr:hypothetical protein BDZ90DRAFT_230533 [Jaminaea rosea]PWN29671.1 hypothetical protein BDZ90DRAFT_230533 [Jaminaea rosea]